MTEESKEMDLEDKLAAERRAIFFAKMEEKRRRGPDPEWFTNKDMQKITKYTDQLREGDNVTHSLKKLSKMTHPKEWFSDISDNPSVLTLNAEPEAIPYIKKICNHLSIPFDSLPEIFDKNENVEQKALEERREKEKAQKMKEEKKKETEARSNGTTSFLCSSSSGKALPTDVNISELFRKEKAKRAAEAESARRQDAKRQKLTKEEREAKFQRETLADLGITSSAPTSSRSVAPSTPLVKPAVTRPPPPPPVVRPPPVLDDRQYRPRRDERRVYCGRSKNAGPRKVGTLLELAQAALVKDPEILIRPLGLTPYDLIQKSLQMMPYEKLWKVRRLNPRLHEDMDQLFLNFIKKDFSDQVNRDFGQKSYAQVCRELYKKREMINNAKLENLRAKFSGKTQCVGRKAIEIDIPIAPPSVRQKQIRNGLSRLTTAATATDVVRARRATMSGDKSQISAIPMARKYIQPSSSTPRGSSSSSSSGTKKAPLWAKTLKQMRGKK